MQALLSSFRSAASLPCSPVTTSSTGCIINNSILGWRKTFAASWKDYDGPFQTLLRAFDSHGSFLKRSLDNQQHQSVQDTHQVLNDHILQYQWDRNYARRQAEEAEIARKHKQCLDVIHWLHSPGMDKPEMQYQDEFLNIRSEYPDTGKWILREDKVQDWIEADIPDHSLMWIHGKKGAGMCHILSRNMYTNSFHVR